MGGRFEIDLGKWNHLWFFWENPPQAKICAIEVNQCKRKGCEEFYFLELWTGSTFIPWLLLQLWRLLWLLLFLWIYKVWEKIVALCTSTLYLFEMFLPNCIEETNRKQNSCKDQALSWKTLASKGETILTGE